MDTVEKGSEHASTRLQLCELVELTFELGITQQEKLHVVRQKRQAPRGYATANCVALR